MTATERGWKKDSSTITPYVATVRYLRDRSETLRQSRTRKIVAVFPALLNLTKPRLGLAPCGSSLVQHFRNPAGVSEMLDAARWRAAPARCSASASAEAATALSQRRMARKCGKVRRTADHSGEAGWSAFAFPRRAPCRHLQYAPQPP